MKGILRTIILVILAAILAAGLLYAYGGSKVKEVNYETTSHSQQIDVKWDRKWGVFHYDIYRIDITGEIYTSDNVPFKKYDKIGSVSGLHTSFDDKTVKNGHYYAYVIKGYGKDKLLCDSFNENITQYECAGLAKPELLNGGYGEDDENSPQCIYLYVQKDGGMDADGVELYRKAKGDKKFERVEPEIPEGGSAEAFDLHDTSVKPGTSYTYKARTFAEENGERIVSEYSESLQLAAVNFIGQYEVTKFKTEGDTLSVTVKSHKYNAGLKIDKGTRTVFATKNKKGKTVSYELAIDKDAVIAAGEKETLTFTCKKGDLPELDQPQGSLTVGDEGYGVEYDIEVFGWTELRVDLDKKKGTVFVDYDN